MSKTSPKKYLCVHADDFALSSSVSRGILETFNNGIVRSTSILPNASDFKDSIRLLQNSSLNCGYHLNLSWGRPLSSLTDVKSLVSHSGFFFSSKYVYLRAIFSLYNFSQVQMEFDKQIQKIQSVCKGLSHLNGHHHIHILPNISELVSQLAIKYKIPFVRSMTNQKANLPEGSFLRKRLLGSFKGAQECFWESKSLKTISHFRGCELSGDSPDLLKRWINFLHHLPEGFTEVMVHPGYVDILKGDSYREGREREVEVLCHPKLQKIISEENIQLISIKDYLRLAK